MTHRAIQPEYAVVTPAYNEEAQIGQVMASVIAQTRTPAAFIVVDDASSDRTFAIASQCAADHGFIRILQRKRTGGYNLEEASEAGAFLAGVAAFQRPYAYLAKLDADITLAPDYFERLIDEFQKNPMLGIASGACYEDTPAGMEEEPVYDQHVRGAARVYRHACWEQIGGVITRLGWDVIDLAKARMRGWETRHFRHLKVHHHVPTGTKAGFVRGRIRSGREEYLLGTYPPFLLAKLAHRALQRPLGRSLQGSFLILYGYLRAALRREERAAERDVQDFLRNEQRARMTKWKQLRRS